MTLLDLCCRSFSSVDTATPALNTLSLHDALPISTACPWRRCPESPAARACPTPWNMRETTAGTPSPARTSREKRSEEHTSELQSLRHLVCRLLLEKKK